jgi:hypothetical protein
LDGYIGIRAFDPISIPIHSLNIQFCNASSPERVKIFTSYSSIDRRGLIVMYKYVPERAELLAQGAHLVLAL